VNHAREVSRQTKQAHIVILLMLHQHLLPMLHQQLQLIVLPIKFVQILDVIHVQEAHTQIPQDPTVHKPLLQLQSHHPNATEIKSLIARVNVLNVVQALSQIAIEHLASTIHKIPSLLQHLVPIIKLLPLVVPARLALEVKFQMFLRHTVNVQPVHHRAHQVLVYQILLIHLLQLNNAHQHTTSHPKVTNVKTVV